MQKSLYKSLTSLKGIIILFIALTHVGAFFYVDYPKLIRNILLPYCHEYMNQFLFIISGFIISYGYRDKISSDKVDFIHFIGKRLKKIYPLYIITNAYALLLSVLREGVIASFNVLRGLLIVLMMNYGWFGTATPYNGPTWFLCIIVQCYIIYYFVAKLYGSRKDLYWLIIALIPAFGYYLKTKNFMFPFCFAANGEAYLCFFVGVIMREVCYKFESLPDIKRKKIVYSILIMYFALISALIVGEKIYSVKVFTGDLAFVNSVLVCPATVFLALYFKPYEKLLSWSPIYSLGKISIYIFFWHWPLLFTLWTIKNRFIPAQAISENGYWIIYIIVLFAVSCGSYRISKRKDMLKLKEK